MAVKVAQRSHGGRGGVSDPLGRGRAAQSHGEEIVVIFFYFIGQSTQHPPTISLPSPMQLASSVVNVRCHRLSFSFLSLSHFVAA